MILVAIVAVVLAVFTSASGFQGFANGKPVWITGVDEMIRVSYDGAWIELLCTPGQKFGRVIFARFVLDDYTLFATTQEPPVLVAVSNTGKFFVCTQSLWTGTAKDWSAVNVALEDLPHQLNPATEGLLLKAAGS